MSTRSLVGLRPGTHCGAALGQALIENGYRVLFVRTTDLVQKPQAARQSLQLEAASGKLDKFDLLIQRISSCLVESTIPR